MGERGESRFGSQMSDAVDRFWAKVDKAGPVAMPELGPCWLWTGAPMANGYGRLRVGGRRIAMTHRFSWELHNGRAAGELQICHRCDVPLCVNPDHLFPGTANDNVQDCISKNRRRICRGETQWSAKLTEDVVRTIRQEFGATRSADLGKRYGVSAKYVWAVARGHKWKHVLVGDRR